VYSQMVELAHLMDGYLGWGGGGLVLPLSDICCQSSEGCAAAVGGDGTVSLTCCTVT
jgi:hypothetical protein